MTRICCCASGREEYSFSNGSAVSLISLYSYCQTALGFVCREIVRKYGCLKGCTLAEI